MQKDFSTINTGRKVASALQQATGKAGRQGTASAEEADRRKSELKTQGRKGCKLTRVNMAFTPENHQFLRTMAKATGTSMTELCNGIIATYRAEHQEYAEFIKDAERIIKAIHSEIFHTEN